MTDHNLLSVKTIPGEYKRLFGRDADLFDVIELLPIVLRQTQAVPKKHIFIQDKIKDFKIITPCVYYSVKYATTPGCAPWRNTLQYLVENNMGMRINMDIQEWQNSMAEANGDVVVNQIPSPAIEVNSNFPMSPTGTYIDFIQRGNFLEFPVTNIEVNILLSVLQVDKEGYPLVTEKVITAMSYFMNMIWCQKKYYAGNLQKYVFDDAKADYDLHAGHALVPDFMSDNEMNDIMNALATYNRHSVNQPFRYG